MNNLKFI